MSRIKISLPEEFIFKTELAIHIGYINYGGHLANDAILSLAHEARIRMLKEYGYSETDVEGCALIMTDTAGAYKSEAFSGEILIAELAFAEISALGFEIVYLFTEKESGREVARFKTGLAFFDYEKRKICHTPEQFKQKFSRANNFD